MVNIPEDTTPCAIITHQAPIRPTFLNNNKLSIIRPATLAVRLAANMIAGHYLKYNRDPIKTISSC